MLNNRLKTILNYIDESDIVADIGTDHGYLLDECLKKGIKFVQGVENKKGPYLRAEANLSNYVKEGKAILSLSDGLSYLDERIDTAVIAGMGGELIRNIISSSFDNAKRLKKLILEPNIKSFELRKYLSENNFSILFEDIALDNDKFYDILVVKYNHNNDCTPLTYKECMFGPILLKNKPILFIKKWQERYNHLLTICNNSNVLLENIENDLLLIKEVLGDDC